MPGEDTLHALVGLSHFPESVNHASAAACCRVCGVEEVLASRVDVTASYMLLLQCIGVAFIV